MGVSDFANYCKSEYGVGGWSTNNGFLDHDAKGIALKIWKTGYEEVYSWTQVAKKLRNLSA